MIHPFSSYQKLQFSGFGTIDFIAGNQFMALMILFVLHNSMNNLSVCSYLHSLTGENPAMPPFELPELLRYMYRKTAIIRAFPIVFWTGSDNKIWVWFLGFILCAFNLVHLVVFVGGTYAFSMGTKIVWVFHIRA